MFNGTLKTQTDTNKEHSNDQESDKESDDEQRCILYLTEDILLLVLKYLTPKDLIR